MWAFRADATYASIGSKLAGEQPPFDLMAVYLGGTDVVGHRFWRYWAPQQFQHPPTAAEVESFGSIIPDYYAYADRVIGELRRAAGEDVTVFVLSDHGMKAVNTFERFDSDGEGTIMNSGGHADGDPGIFVAAGPGIRKMKGASAPGPLRKEALAVVGSVRDVTPTLLALLAIPIGADMDGRVLTNLLDAALLAAQPIRTVVTHDTREWLESRPKATIAAPDEEKRREQLRALGYLE
jgi:arylsulfatase A-like enzyme